MKKYFNFDQLIKKEYDILKEYAHILMVEKPEDDEFKEVFYLSKPRIYVCVTDETNENNLNKIILGMKDGKEQ